MTEQMVIEFIAYLFTPVIVAVGLYIAVFYIGFYLVWYLLDVFIVAFKGITRRLP